MKSDFTFHHITSSRYRCILFGVLFIVGKALTLEAMALKSPSIKVK